MKITTRRLKQIIAEEYARAEQAKSRRVRRRRRNLQEGTRENPVQVTPQLLNRIIREEYEAFQQMQRLAESRRRRRKLAEARRRRLNRR